MTAWGTFEPKFLPALQAKLGPLLVLRLALWAFHFYDPPSNTGVKGLRIEGSFRQMALYFSLVFPKEGDGKQKSLQRV